MSDSSSRAKLPQSNRILKAGLSKLLFLSLVLLACSARADQSSGLNLSVRRHSAVNEDPSGWHLRQTPVSDADEAPQDEIEKQLEENVTVTDVTQNDYERVLQNFEYFNLGFKGDELALNFTECATRGAYWYWLELQTYLVKLKFGNGDQNIFNTTLFLQNSTNMLEFCTDASENIYYFVLWKQTQFPTWLDFGLGFLQNLLANVMRLNTINKRLKELKDDEKDKELYYIGVIIRMLIVFDPVADELSRINPGDGELINSLFVDGQKHHPRPLKQVDIEGHDERTGFEAFLTPVGMLDFFEGTVAGTDLVSDMTKMRNCTQIIREDFFRKSLEIYRQGAAIDVFGIIYSFYHMVWYLHPLFGECKQSPDDLVPKLKARFDDHFDAKVIMVNVIHNYPLMVDIALDLKKFFTASDKGQTEKGPYEAGFGMGRLVYYLLSDNPLAEMVDPAADRILPFN